METATSPISQAQAGIARVSATTPARDPRGRAATALFAKPNLAHAAPELDRLGIVAADPDLRRGSRDFA